MRAYLPLTSIVHTHRHRQRCLLIDWSLPHHWAGPMLTSSLDPQGFTKVKGQSVQIVPPVAVCSAWKTGPCSRYCFPINSTWLKKKIARLLDWMCRLHVPMGNSHLRDQSETGHSIRPVFFFFLAFCGPIGNPNQIERGSLPPSLFLPDRLKCRASYVARALRVRGASGCAWSSDVVAVWHVRHAFTALWKSWIELERLSRHERRGDGQRKRMRAIQREGEEGFQLTMECSLLF